MTESNVCQQVARYLQVQYPNVIYRFDLAADLKLTIGQASRHKRLHPRRGYPDLWIAEPSMYYSNEGSVERYSGMYIEIKNEGVQVYKKDNTIRADKHLQEQAAMMRELESKGYFCSFASGFEEVKELLDAYLQKGEIECESSQTF